MPAKRKSRAALAECSNLAREMANEPSKTLTPREFARRAAAVASDGGASVEILDETRIEQLGMGMLLGSRAGAASRRGYWCSGTTPLVRRLDRCSAWSGKASPSIPAAFRSSRPTVWSG